MALLKKIKMEKKTHLKIRNELYVIETSTKPQFYSEEATMFRLQDNAARSTQC